MLKGAAAVPAALAVGTGLQAFASTVAPSTASAAPLGVLLDYAAGVISASDIRAAGALGAIRYVSDRRPGGAWMLGKPIQLPEARDLYHNGLKIVSCYQYGKQDSADWLGGQNAGVAHAKRGWQLHVAAGGSYGAPIYASIDDDPTYEQYKQQVALCMRHTRVLPAEPIRGVLLAVLIAGHDLQAVVVEVTRLGQLYRLAQHPGLAGRRSDTYRMAPNAPAAGMSLALITPAA